MRIVSLCIFPVVLFVFCSCQVNPKKKWSIAVVSHNSKYENCASLLRDLFQQKDYELTLIQTSSAVEAARMVAEGKADFTLSMSHSDFIRPKLGEWARELRIAMPMFENALYLFHRSDQRPESVIELVDHSRIFLEVTDSLAEQYIGLKRVLSMLNVTDYEFVNDSARATLIPIWGTFSGALTRQMLAKKWTLYSMEPAFIEYALIIEPRFGRLTVPIRYTGNQGKGVSTLLSTAHLITGSHVDRNELQEIITMIYDNRVFLTLNDKSYMAIREDFNARNLNFPLHAGTTAFLNRYEPSFLERNAEYLGLLVTLLLIAFGFFQWLHRYVAQKKKDRIDVYFQQYDAITKNPDLTPLQRMNELEALRSRAIEQMVVERLHIQDFNVLNQAIEYERIIQNQRAALKKSDS